MTVAAVEALVPGRVASRRDRDGFVEAAQAMRSAIDAVLDLPDLTAGEAKVFLAVLRDVVSWSRTWDAVTRSRLAETARVSTRTVTRAMKRLAEVGALVWHPSQDQGRPSVVEVGSEVEGQGADLGTARVSTLGTSGVSHIGDGRGVEEESAGDDDWDDETRLDAAMVVWQAADTLGAVPADLGGPDGSDAVDAVARLLRDGAGHVQVFERLVAAPPPRQVRSWGALLIGRLRPMGGYGAVPRPAQLLTTVGVPD